MKYGDYLKIKYENRNCKKSNTNDAENKLFYEYKELYYLIEFDEKKKYSATVYEIPEITTSGNLDISSCEDSIKSLIDKYIFENKINLYNYPRPIPNGVDFTEDVLKASASYNTRKIKTISLNYAFRDKNENLINKLKNLYEENNIQEINAIIEKINNNEENYFLGLKHGDIIKKILTGLPLYENISGKQIRLKDMLATNSDIPNFHCVYLPIQTGCKLTCESLAPPFRHFPDTKTAFYKILFPASAVESDFCLPILITRNEQTVDRLYLTISKINSDTFSYTFEGSTYLGVLQNITNLCAKKIYIDKLQSIVPKSFLNFQNHDFELFIFEISKFIQYCILTDYNSKKINDYLLENVFLSSKFQNLLIKIEDLNKTLITLTPAPRQNTISLDETFKSIEEKKYIDENDFNILRNALLNSREFELDQEKHRNCTIYCWTYIQQSFDYDIFATIVLLNIRDGLGDAKIFDKIREIYKPDTQVQRKLGTREKFLKGIANKAQIIRHRYNTIYEIAEKYGLPNPPLKKSEKNTKN
jgi:predicted RNase H-like HicB family nuclease